MKKDEKDKVPKLANWLLSKFVKDQFHEEFLGDLQELYQDRISTRNKFKARFMYWVDALHLLLGFIFLKGFKNRNPIMFKHNLIVSLRNLKRRSFYTGINIAGMTIGMTCFMLIALYIQYELSYDVQHEKADQIYRVAQIQEGNDFRGTDRFALAPMPLAPTLKAEFPEVQAATTLQVREALLSNEEQVFYERGLFSDEYVFDVFTYPIKEGVGKEALEDPNAIILTESLAKKYFGEESPIGKTLLFENDRLLTIKGIVEDMPKNQHFTFDYITSFKNLPWYQNDIGAWNSNNYRAYVVLPEGYDYKELEAKLPLLDHKYLKNKFHGAQIKPIFFLQPLKEIHLHSQINFEISANSDVRYIYLSTSIAFIILLLASINYMNLTTAGSAKRVKEVGTRKVLGAKRGQLVSQFMAESILITLFSFGMAIGLAYLLLPAFNQLMNQQIPFTLGSNRIVLLGMLSAAVLLGGLSGLYPALLSSVITPVNALKGGWFKNRKDGAFLSNTLVVGQFTAVIVLAIGSLVIYQQLQYIQNKKLGYNRDQVIYVPYRQVDFYEKTAIIRTELLKHPQLEKVSFAANMLLNVSSARPVNNWEGNNNEQSIRFFRNYIDYDFIDLVEIALVEGRNFSPEHPTDSTGIILNESAVKAMGWESAVGKAFNGRQVIGVVKDFHFQPFDLTIEPLYLVLRTKDDSFYYGNIVIKAKMDDLDNTVAHIHKTLKSILPQIPIEHRIMDESYDQLYRSEKRIGTVLNIFTLIALFIACMGLFGLVSHNILQRTKEIGIRKVLGASISNIVSIISKDFLKLVMLSVVIAVPIAWWIMSKWLQDFAYRIDMDWWLFALIGLLAIGVAFLTVSTQAIKAAVANPVDSLKEE